MTRIAGILGAFVVLVGFVYLVVPPPYPGIYDADLRRLAETAQEAWCAGEAYFTPPPARPAKAAQCRAERPDLSAEINHSIVVESFCRGAHEVRDYGDINTACVQVVNAAEMWPTRDGMLSSAWTQAYPYPGGSEFRGAPTDGGGGGGSRTGDRPGNTREGFTR